jgi:hypothetical protein
MLTVVGPGCQFRRRIQDPHRLDDLGLVRKAPPGAAAAPTGRLPVRLSSPIPRSTTLWLIERERIAVGNGALFLDDDTEHTRFQKG